MLGLQINADLFQYHQDRLFVDPWRIWTAHLVHINFLHLVLNIAALWCLSLLFHPPHWGWFYSAGVVAAGCISLYVNVYLPEYQYYRGLSGVLHGWYIGMAMWGIWQPPRRAQWFAAVIMIVLMVKVGAEQSGYWRATGQMLEVDVLYDAHTIGLLSVMAFTFLWQMGVRLSKKGV